MLTWRKHAKSALVLALLALFYLCYVDVKFRVLGEYISTELQASCVRPASQPARYPLSITTVTKNSGPYIREWLEYHRIVGVDHFFILDNESDDDLYRVLQPYIEQGIVTHVPWPNQVYRDEFLREEIKTQQKGIMYALSVFGCRSEWTALIDDDEFLLPKENKTIKEILADYGNVGGLAVAWALFGSNGHITKPDLLVIEAYTKRREKLHHLYKTIVRPDYVLRMRTIHYPTFVGGHPLVTEHHDVVSTNWKYNHPSTDKIQLNHYKAKSQEEWLERAEVRGSVAGMQWKNKGEHFHKYLDTFNEVEDKEMLERPYLAELKRRLAVKEVL